MSSQEGTSGYLYGDTEQMGFLALLGAMRSYLSVLTIKLLALTDSLLERSGMELRTKSWALADKHQSLDLVLESRKVRDGHDDRLWVVTCRSSRALQMMNKTCCMSSVCCATETL